MKVLVDDQLSARLGEVREPVEVRDTSGRTYGYFHPVAAPRESEPRAIHSPISDEELARRQKVPGGRPLAEIWRDLAGR